jgi:hypothetical protein
MSFAQTEFGNFNVGYYKAGGNNIRLLVFWRNFIYKEEFIIQ